MLWRARSLIHVCFALIDNYVDGKEFIRLSKEDITKMVPPVGLANKIMRLQAKVASKSVSMNMHVHSSV